MRRSWRCLGAIALAAASFAVGLSAAAAPLPPLPTGVGCEANAHVRPAQVILSCADDNSYFGSIHWTTWTAASATGTGQFMLNSCTPNCATSRVVDRGAVRLVASDPTSSAGRFAFIRLRATRLSTHRSVTLTWAWTSTLLTIGTWHGSTAPLIAAG
ncbi:MAG TPA: hypothetical protein VGS61_00665 [Acidimicrobiales bacterium]|nr:hypothetical protein [Acidimicrobiales bacterium]